MKICDFSTLFINTLSYGISFYNLPSIAISNLASFEGKDEMIRMISTLEFIALELCCIRLDSIDLEIL